MKRTVEMRLIVSALQVTEQNVRQREGLSFPPPVSDRPRLYLLEDVLWWIDGQERTIILQALHIDVQNVRNAIAQAVDDSSRYHVPVPRVDDGDDPLMQ